MFLKFFVIGEVCFRYNTQYLSLLKHHRSIDKSVFRAKRHPYNGKNRQVSCGMNQFDEGFFRLVEQQLSTKQIHTGVGGYG